MDRTHKSLLLLRRDQVIGGISYRTFQNLKFGDFALCAVKNNERFKGYGTRLMNHLKQHARDVDGLTHFLTYAYTALGYFTKQGFTQEIHLDKHAWEGYIKEHDGRILMECEIYPKVAYTDLSTMIRRQKQAICDVILRQLSDDDIVYPDRKELCVVMCSLLKSMKDHEDALPFMEPVDAEKVPDYYDIIKDPMDLETMRKRMESEEYYVTLDKLTCLLRMPRECLPMHASITLARPFITNVLKD